MEQAYWGPKSETFEYWSHAACVLPLEDWPAYAFKRRVRREKGRRWHVLQEKDKTCNEVLARLRAEGPLTANELGGAKKGGPWWDWSETKIAAEWLLDIGELVCRERRGFARVYDLAERAIPAELLDQEWSDEDCAVRLVTAAGRSLGVATEADLAVYHGVPRALVRRALPSSGLTEVSVAGWKQAAFADPGALSAVGSRMRGRTVMLSPFDSLIWYRERLERLFDVRHRLEAYTPKEKRVYGYFAMPVLDGTRVVGLVDPGRRGEVAGGQAGDAVAPRCGGAGGAGAGGGGFVGRRDVVRGRAGGAGFGPGRAPGGGGRGARRVSRSRALSPMRRRARRSSRTSSCRHRRGPSGPGGAGRTGRSRARRRDRRARRTGRAT